LIQLNESIRKKKKGPIHNLTFLKQNNILAMDAQGSEMVYNEQRFTRHGAIPDFALKRKTLLLETVTVSIRLIFLHYFRIFCEIKVFVELRQMA
jgi:hypothetical protein